MKKKIHVGTKAIENMSITLKKFMSEGYKKYGHDLECADHPVSDREGGELDAKVL